MQDDKPRLTNSANHLDSPVRLSEDDPLLRFTGDHTGVHCNGEQLFSLDKAMIKTDYFLWGPPMETPETIEHLDDRIRLAGTILGESIQHGFHLDDSATYVPPPSHSNSFMVPYFKEQLAEDFRSLPTDSFEITSKDIQTWLCCHWNEIAPYIESNIQKQERRDDREVIFRGLKFLFLLALTIAVGFMIYKLFAE